MRSNKTHGATTVATGTGLGFLIASGFFTVQATAASPPERQYVTTQRPDSRVSLPFSEAVVVGDTLHIAGHIGIDQKTGQAPADAEQEARLVMDAIKGTVTKAGFEMSDVVSLEVFCTDLKLYDTFNAVYRTYFTGNYPARAFIGAKEILRGGHFEVLGVAVKSAKK